MEASLIDKEKYGGQFPESQKIVAGDKIDCVDWQEYTTKDGFKGVSLKGKSGKLFYSTAVAVVGFVKSAKTDLKGLIAKSPDGAITIYFKNVKPTDSTRTSMLQASFYP